MRENMVALVKNNVCEFVCGSKKAAEILGVHQSTLSHYINGLTTPESGYEIIRIGYTDDYFEYDEFLEWSKEWDATRKSIRKGIKL